jgi:eukaryotic-like serine/threonine-protein kinase
MRFSYSSGQRPLEGYTLKRGIGKGGFGEVYFAISDGGKEVALKLVRGDREIEMRGMSQCLNLKHSNLVSLFDIRPDAHGDQWVVMEYIAGESLSTVLARHPNGLPRELVREWFLALTKAVGYLHDHGIVHRDLKPGNIFLENGVLKVGDYGLSKSISQSGHGGQTDSVGTVHYMAPEISTGNYNKQIDVYAAGVILYEMLTGKVPFEGESAGEILMKHLTKPPDLSKLPNEYLPIVAKALAKNPAQRYASMTEMGRAIEKIGGVPPAGARAAIPILSPADKTPKAAMPTPPEPPIMTALPATTLRGQLLELCGSMSFSVLFALLATTLWAAIAGSRDLGLLGTMFFLTVATSWAVLVPGKFFAEKRGDAWRRRFVMMVLGGLIGILSLYLTGWSLNRAGNGDLIPTELPTLGGSIMNTFAVNEAGYLSYFALAFFALRWWRMTDRRRASRFSFGPVLAATFWALVLLLPLGVDHWKGAVALVLSSVIVQIVSPWEQPKPKAAVKKMRLHCEYA